MMKEICIATYTCLVQFLQKVSFHGPESMLEEDDGITTPLLLHYDDVSSRQVSAWCCSFAFFGRFTFTKLHSCNDFLQHDRLTEQQGEVVHLRQQVRFS